MKTIKIAVIVFLLTSCARDWNYEGSRGPQRWGELKEEFKFCKIGYNQSPIDIDFKSINGRFLVKDQGLDYVYSDSGVTKEKMPHNIRFSFDRQDYFQWYRKKYYLRFIEFHHPSEHLVNGEQEILEMQIFHKSDSEQTAVLAFFVEMGEENQEMNKLIELLKTNKKDVWSEFNVSKVIDQKSKSFFYDGSLTVPPCTEGIKWYVMKNKVAMSKEQINTIITLALGGKANVRPVQDFNPELY